MLRQFSQDKNACDNLTPVAFQHLVIHGIEPQYDFEGIGNYHNYLVRSTLNGPVQKIRAPVKNVPNDPCMDFSHVTTPVLKPWSKIASMCMYGPLLPYAIFIQLFS